MYALILAGGSGTRLWPYSRSNRPKQFLSLTGERTMLQTTVDRIRPALAPDRVYVATSAAYADLVAEQLPDVPRANILIEPSGRGTAPCVGLAALHLRRRDPEAVMAVLSADHDIEQVDSFRATLAFATEMASKGYLVTLGITPTAPSTGYGYIERGGRLGSSNSLEAYSVARFVEKPDAERARSYVDSGRYLWNAGMFVWRADRILTELAKHRSLLAHGLQLIDAALDTPAADARLQELWPQLENVAIDVAVMEQTEQAVVIPSQLGWSDVGDWAAVADTLPSDSQRNAVVGKHIGIQTSNSLIYGNGRLVATIGVEDLLIIDTHDVLLICPRDRAQDVKAMVAQVREQHQDVL